MWDRVRASYDSVAEAYETRFLHELDGKPHDRELLAALAASVEDPVLDVGCGPGQIGLAVRGHGRRVIGIDFSSAMAHLAAGRLDGAVSADMRALPFRSRSIGGVVAFYSVIHVRRDEVRLVLAEFARVLRPGGRVLLSAHEGEGEIELDEFLGKHVPMVATFFTLDELVDAITAASLDVVSAERRAPYAIESQTARLYVEATSTGQRGSSRSRFQ